MPLKSIEILQITDTHLFADTHKTLLGLNTEESYRAVLSLATHNDPSPSALLLTGDLSQDESSTAYRRLAESLELYKCPKYFIPGNHDNCSMMTEIFTAKSNYYDEKSFSMNNWHITLLNSQKKGCVEGELSKEELENLEQSLKVFKNHHHLIFLHHHILPIQSKWLDNLNVTNSEDLLSIIARYPKQVKAVTCGHVHQASETKYLEIPFLSSPSTCIQFTPKHDQFAVEKQYPGYRKFCLYEDGTFETDIKRAKDLSLPDFSKAKGY